MPDAAFETQFLTISLQGHERAASEDIPLAEMLPENPLDAVIATLKGLLESDFDRAYSWIRSGTCRRMAEALLLMYVGVSDALFRHTFPGPVDEANRAGQS